MKVFQSRALSQRSNSWLGPDANLKDIIQKYAFYTDGSLACHLNPFRKNLGCVLKSVSNFGSHERNFNPISIRIQKRLNNDKL